ncbi:non-hydrolyzing UDP-N-acetylglucosamine 2-epimerase [Falsiroseomonas sp. CW058]|uniref:non-hydrolyzing UDP-N-acetylglucosamine 2-epimerase n=1 Tax=Falsiroseomonas sp. CW058 TaxID=3388664 RepID=UPI003D31636E
MSSRASPPRVMVVFGTRPEAIKMMPVLAELRRRPGLAAIGCSTGQHREMLDQVLDAFGESCDVDLGLMSPGQTLPQLTARVILAMTEVFEKERPDMVLVHGDTTTAMAAAIAAFYARVAIGHVEAGLRSFDLTRPWPEEFNRVAVDAIADLMFAPTESSAANLRGEYNRRGRVLVTGNTGIDALLGMAARLDGNAELRAQVAAGLPALAPGKRLVVVTGHRRESFGPGFQRICDGLAAIAARPDVEIVYPVHLNPNVRDVVLGRLGGQANIHLIPPVGYAEMVFLMKAAAVLVTDSGGIQEEGPALGKPVLVMRDVTERPEALTTGVVKLIGTDPALMQAEVGRLLDDAAAYAAMARPVFPYGDGQAARRIADAIEEWAGR